MTGKVVRVVLALAGALFVLMGLRWIADPASAAAALGMPILTGMGRSSLVGDMAAFFLVSGSFTLIGVVTKTRHWFYAPILLLSVAAIARLMAWAFHDAALATQFIATEVVVASLLWFGSGVLAEDR